MALSTFKFRLLAFGIFSNSLFLAQCVEPKDEDLVDQNDDDLIDLTKSNSEDRSVPFDSNLSPDFKNHTTDLANEKGSSDQKIEMSFDGKQSANPKPLAQANMKETVLSEKVLMQQQVAAKDEKNTKVSDDKQVPEKSNPIVASKLDSKKSTKYHQNQPRVRLEVLRGESECLPNQEGALFYDAKENRLKYCNRGLVTEVPKKFAKLISRYNRTQRRGFERPRPNNRVSQRPSGETYFCRATVAFEQNYRCSKRLKIKKYAH